MNVSGVIKKIRGRIVEERMKNCVNMPAEVEMVEAGDDFKIESIKFHSDDCSIVCYDGRVTFVDKLRNRKIVMFKFENWENI